MVLEDHTEKAGAEPGDDEDEAQLKEMEVRTDGWVQINFATLFIVYLPFYITRSSSGPSRSNCVQSLLLCKRRSQTTRKRKRALKMKVPRKEKMLQKIAMKVATQREKEPRSSWQSE